MYRIAQMIIMLLSASQPSRCTFRR